MTLDKNVNVENLVSLPIDVYFQEYCLQDEKRLQSILDIILDPHQSLPETIQKHLTTIKSYLSSGQSFDEFCKEVRKYNNNVLCGLVWTNATISYRCRTCATNPCMSLCSDCFHGGNHDGHDANMFRSVGGGICDCGDVTVMNSNGFCKYHGPNRIPNEQIPYKLIRCAQILLPRLILRLIQHLRSRVPPIKSDTYSTIEEFISLTPLFDLFDTLCNTGSSICSILTNCLLDTEFYREFNTQLSIDNLSNISYDIYLQHLNETSNLLIPISLRTVNSSVYFDIKKATCLLDELLFWLIKYHLPERLLKILLILLTNLNFKHLFTQSFLNIYGIAINQLINSRNSHRKTNTSRLVHISVQLFSNYDITIQAIKNYHLMEIMLSSLYSIFSNILINCQLQKTKENYHLIISESDFSKNMYYWPIISDFINVLSHEYASKKFVSEKRFWITWIKIISWFQGMNVNYHNIESEQFFQSNTNYLFAFTTEIECCAMTLWTMINYIITPDFLEITSKAINRLFMIIKEWFSAIGFEQYTDILKNQITFHIPLHRYISILTYISLHYQNGQLKTLFPIDNQIFLLNLAIFPLRIQVIKYEILTNRIWLYNGYDMQIQLNMYSNSRGNICSYMNDADIFLLQLISTLVNINTFMQMLFHSFYVHEWLVQNTQTNLVLDKTSYITLLEGSLIILATIIVFTPNLALDDFECRRIEMINTLAIQDCLYSYLDEHIAQSKGFSTAKHDIQTILNDIAEYIPPIIEIMNAPKQGQYKLKDFIWEDEFDPLYVLARINRRDLFQTTMQRYTKSIKSMKKFSNETNLWPPYRLHKPKDQFQLNIRSILQSRYLHGILFSICHWMINETIIHEDILSLLVYLCELTIDDQYRRLKYGEFLNGYVPSTTKPSQYDNNSKMTDSISLETLTSLEEDENFNEHQQHTIELSEIKLDEISSNQNHELCSNLKISSYEENNILKRLTEIEQCYGRRAIKLNEISESEQKIQKQWDELILTKDSSVSNQMSYSIPSYDLENQFITRDSSKIYLYQNNHSTVKQERNQSKLKEKNKLVEGIIDGKYETYYEQDNFLINAHTIIENISFERFILDTENDANECLIEKKLNKEIDCTNTHLDQSMVNFKTVSIQTNSKQIIESKFINMSLIQMLVHLLAKIISSINEINNNKSSLNSLFDTIRLKKKSDKIGDGTLYLTRLLIKLENLCDECKRQINGLVNELDQKQLNNNTEYFNQKDKSKAMQEKLFEQISKKQQILLTESIDEHEEEVLSIDNKNNNVECCICQSKDDKNPLGLVIRLIDTGVLGVREFNDTLNNYLPLTMDNSNDNEILLKDSLTCCHLNSKLNDKQQLIKDNNIYTNCKHKNRITCAQFYEEKIHSMLEIFSQESISKSITINWRTGIIINSCGHSIHFSCYKQYKKIHLESDSYVEFKCPMCRQISNGLIYIPFIDKPIESNENLIETITDLIEKNIKSNIEISPLIDEWLENFIEKIYLIINKNQRIFNKELNDDILALFLVSLLRFNLENDLLIRDTKYIHTKLINRKLCFRELFYICNLKYSSLVKYSHISLWYRITGLNDKKKSEKIINSNKSNIPLLLSDPIILLLQIILSLPFSITKKFYQVIVQALFNLTYIQALFTIVIQMNKTEQKIWSTENLYFDSNNMIKYLRIISFQLFETNFNSNTDHSKIWSLQSINASIHEQCQHFIKIASLIQHHLYQPITWWLPGCSFEFDFLWKNLLKELELYDIGEPYWFCNDSVSLILNWLDEILRIDKQQSILIRKIARTIPSFHPPRFIELPTYYSDLFRSCIHLHCPYCQTLIIEPILCLICGIIYSQERFEQKCCDQQTNFIKEHLMACSGGLNISININSTKTLIQRERRYTYWSSLYLDQHGEEDLHLRRGRILYLDENRLKLLYSSWISSNVEQLITRWSTDQFDF